MGPHDDAPAVDPSMIALITTEIYAGEGARTRILMDMQGRVTQFLTAVSSAIVALAFIGQLAKLGPAFRMFASVILPTLYVFGVLVFLRLGEASVEDAACLNRLARLRRWYLERVPALHPVVMVYEHDDIAGIARADVPLVLPGHLQWLVTIQAVVAFIDSVVAGSFVGILTSGINRIGLWWFVFAVAAGAFSLGWMYIASNRQWNSGQQALERQRAAAASRR